MGSIPRVRSERTLAFPTLIPAPGVRYPYLKRGCKNRFRNRVPRWQVNQSTKVPFLLSPRSLVAQLLFEHAATRASPRGGRGDANRRRGRHERFAPVPTAGWLGRGADAPWSRSRAEAVCRLRRRPRATLAGTWPDQQSVLENTALRVVPLNRSSPKRVAQVRARLLCATRGTGGQAKS